MYQVSLSLSMEKLYPETSYSCLAEKDLELHHPDQNQVIQIQSAIIIIYIHTGLKLRSLHPPLHYMCYVFVYNFYREENFKK